MPIGVLLYKLLFIALISNVLANSHHKHNEKYNHPHGEVFSKSYFVELKDDTVNATQAFLNLMRDHHIEDDVHIHRVITHKFLKAISIEIVDEERESAVLNAIINNHMIQSVSPISVIEPVDFYSPEVEYRIPIKSIHNLTGEQVDFVSPHRLSQVDKVHNDLNLTGEGLFIGIIDSGVDYTHPALGGGFGEGFKVVAGYDFVGNQWNSSDPNSKPEPKNDPLDNCGKKSKASGHGTHVSGIIAGYDASNNFTGVAPGAKLGMWRVFSCGGSARSDIVIEAMLKAYDAGIDILSMSLGTTIPWSAPNDLQSKIVSKIAASGVSVVISAGNSGTKGAFTVGAPANAVDAFEVASVNNEYIYFDGSFTATGVSDPIGFNFANGTNLIMPDGSWAPSFEGGIHGNISADACTPESVSKEVEGKIALVKRGGCEFTEKVENVKEAGGFGVIIFDSNNEPYQNSIQVKNASLPIYFISQQDGIMLSKLYTPGADLKLEFLNDNGLQFFKSPYSGAVSSFSSVGPTSDLFFKPNIAAVGQLIYSTIPQYMGSWGIKQGTSMACPYVAGSIALYLQYHGVHTKDRRTVHELFQNYAYLESLDNTTSGYLDNPVRQGAGLIQVYDTIMQSVHASPAQISFNDTFSDDHKTQEITIFNNGSEPISYRLFNNVSVSVEPFRQLESGRVFNNHPAHTGFDYADITFSEDEIYLDSGESRTVQVTVQPPNTDSILHVIYGGFIQFDPIKSTESSNSLVKAIHVPYFGISGSQRDIPVFDVNYKQTVRNNGTDTTFDFEDTIPYEFDPAEVKEDDHASLLFNFTLFSPTLILKGELLDTEMKFIGYPFQPISFVQRDFYKDKKPREPLVWNGQYFKNLTYDVLSYRDDHTPKIPQEDYISVEDGSYYIRISALKQFGDIQEIDDWESFVAGPIEVKRLDLS